MKEHPLKDMIPSHLTCPMCEQCKPIALFHKSPKGKYGLAAYCKICAAQVGKRSLAKPEVKAKADKRRKDYYYEHQEEQKQSRQQWYQANRERVLEGDHQFRKEHPEILAERWQRWAKTERGYEHCRVRVRNRHARSKGAQGNYTFNDIQKQYANQKGKCYYCRVKIKNHTSAYHIEHVIPLSRGGTNDMSNIVLACPSCNLSKSNKLPHEWPQGNRLL